MIYQAPPITVQAHRNGHSLAIAGRFNLDPQHKCQPVDWKNLREIDNGEAGIDNCGSPNSTTLTIHVGTQTIKRTVRVSHEKGWWRIIVKVPAKKVRWTATVFNPIGGEKNLSASGHA